VLKGLAIHPILSLIWASCGSLKGARINYEYHKPRSSKIALNKPYGDGSKMNKKQVDDKFLQLSQTRTVIEKYGTYNIREIRHFLMDDFNLTLHEKTIRRYRMEIREADKLAKKIRNQEKRKIAKVEKTVTKKIKQDEYPLFVKCPSKMRTGEDCVNFRMRINHRNHSVTCMIHGYEFNPKIGHWIDIHTGIKVGWKPKKTLAGTAPLSHGF
jgi:hypothetical protein